MVLLKEWINISDFVFMISSDLVLNETMKSFCFLVQFPYDHFWEETFVGRLIMTSDLLKTAPDTVQHGAFCKAETNEIKVATTVCATVYLR